MPKKKTEAQLIDLFTDVFNKHAKYFPYEEWSTSFERRAEIILSGMIFRDESWDAFNRIIDWLFDNKKWIRNRFTREDIVRIVQNRIWKGIEYNQGKFDVPKEIIQKIVKELLAELSLPLSKFTVIAPFSNIILKSDISLANVCWYKYTKDKLSEVPDTSRMKKSLWAIFGDKIVGEVDVSASSGKKAEELAQLEYDTALSLLRVIYPRATISFSTNFIVKKGTTSYYVGRFKEPAWSFNFDDEKLSKGVDMLRSIMNPVILGEKENNLTKRCLQALRWYGTAVGDNFAPDKFVKLVTALEVLVLTGKFSGKCGLTEEFGENLSILIILHQKTREQVKKEMKKIYGIRSAIVHRADYDKLREEYITLVQKICQMLIISISENAFKFKDFKEYLNHAEKLRSAS